MRATCRIGGIGGLGFVVENRSGGPRYLRPLLLTFTLVVDIGTLPPTLVRRHGTPTGVGIAAAGKRFGAHLSSLLVIIRLSRLGHRWAGGRRPQPLPGDRRTPYPLRPGPPGGQPGRRQAHRS